MAAKEKLLALAARSWRRARRSQQLFMISALTGDGVADLKDYLAAHVPPGPWHYPAEDLSDAPLRMLAAEITREKIFHRLHDELPYATTVETTAWQERKDGSVRIEQTIFVDARRPEGDRARQGRADDQADLDGGARRAQPRSSSARCISSCSSRCARAGRTIPSATARWVLERPQEMTLRFCDAVGG